MVGRIAIGPAAQLLRSQSLAARRVAARIADLPFLQRKSEEGISSGPSIASKLREYDGQYVSGVIETRQIYADYRKAGGTLSKSQFQEQVGLAMSRGDRSEIPHVAQAAKAWRTRVDWLKQRAVNAGALPEGVAAEFAETYFPRMYRASASVEGASRLRRALEDYWVRVEGMDAEEAASLAEDTVATMKGGATAPPGNLKVVPRAGATQERTLAIPDEVLHELDVLDTDVLKVMRGHFRDMGVETELRVAFGDKDMRGIFKEINLEYDRLIDAARTKKAKVRLDNERRAVRRNLTAMRDRLTGVHGRPDDPDAWINIGERALRAGAMTAFLGGTLFSQLPDFARPIIRQGLLPMAKGLHAFMTDVVGRKISRKELQKIGTAAELVLNQRIARLSDLDSMGRYSQGLSEFMAKWSGLSGITSVQQELAGAIAADTILNSSLKVAAGTASKKEISNLARSGIDLTMARRIADKYDGGTFGTLKIADTDGWTRIRSDGVEVDADVTQAYRGALGFEARMSVQEPGIGDIPTLFSSTQAGRLISQFQGFTAGSHNRSLVAGLQQFDAQWLTGLTTQVTLGAMVLAIKDSVRGRDIADRSPGQLLADSIDRSGVAGFWNIPMNATRQLYFEDTPSKWLARSTTGKILGPGIGLLRSAVEAGTAVLMGEGKARDVLRVLPYNDMLHLRSIMEQFGLVPYEVRKR